MKDKRRGRTMIEVDFEYDGSETQLRGAGNRLAAAVRELDLGAVRVSGAAARITTGGRVPLNGQGQRDG